MESQDLYLSIFISHTSTTSDQKTKQDVSILNNLNIECVNLLWTMPEQCRASFEMGSSSFSTKISFSFINIKICICPLLKVLVLLQLSTFLLPISEVFDRKYFKSYHNLHINNGGVIFMVSELSKVQCIDVGGHISVCYHWYRRKEKLETLI